MKTKVSEPELRNYWRASRHMNQMLRSGIAPEADLVQERLAEIEAISLHTDWPTLQKICIATVTSVDTRTSLKVTS